MDFFPPSEILETCFLRGFLRICFFCASSMSYPILIESPLAIGNFYKVDWAGACVALACFVEGLTSKVPFYPKTAIGLCRVLVNSC